MQHHGFLQSVIYKKLLQGLKKIVYKFHGDPTFRWKIISEKQCYAVMKYILAIS